MSEGTLGDITERKQIEAVLWQANLIIESSPVMFFRWQAAEGWPVYGMKLAAASGR
jgi:hypothetical protein